MQVSYSGILQSRIARAELLKKGSFAEKKERLIIRAVSSPLGILAGVTAGVNLTSRSLRYLIGGLLSRRLWEMQKGANLAKKACIQAACLPAIGFIGVCKPEKAVELGRLKHFKIKEDGYQAYKVPVAQIAGVFNGAIFSAKYAILCLTTLATAPLTVSPKSYVSTSGKTGLLVIKSLIGMTAGTFNREIRTWVFVKTC